MKHHAVLFAAALVAFAGIAPAGEPAAKPHATDAEGVPLQGPVEFDKAAPHALQVKRLKSGHILVRPIINGHDAGWYIFDTGAGICCISTPEVEGKDLKPAGNIQTTGVGGATSASLYNASELRLGPATFHDHTLMAVDLSFLESKIGEKICGVIGYGVLSKSIAEIDLSVPSISLFSADGYTLSSGQWTDIDLKGRVPTAAGSFEGHPARFRLDLGATGSVTFHQPAVEKYDLLKDRKVGNCKMGGVGGFVDGKRGTITSLELGGIKFDNVDADFALEAKGSFADPAIDANIGTDILKRYLIVTDYPHERMGLLPKPDEATGQK